MSKPSHQLNLSSTGPNANEAPPLVWSHGLMLNMRFDAEVGWIDWNAIAHSSRLIRYDARGHGESPPATTPEEARWDRLGEDMIAIADAKEAKNFIAGGQSMGAATALFAALFEPQRVKALVLMTPPTAWERRAAQADNYRRMAERLEKRGVAGVAQLVALSPAMPEWMFSAHPEKSALAVNTVRGFQVDPLKNILLGAGLSNLPDAERLKSLEMPALILAWEGDLSHPLETSEKLAEILPNSELVIARNLTDVAFWTSVVSQFIQKV